jgi:hypothetical protein
MNEFHLTIRVATPGDVRAVERLAALDSAPRFNGRVLLAEADGELVAAISLVDGAVIADPFKPTAEIVRLLRLRRYQIARHADDARLSSLPIAAPAH